jgi:hypothetical protein
LTLTHQKHFGTMIKYKAEMTLLQFIQHIKTILTLTQIKFMKLNVYNTLTNNITRFTRWVNLLDPLIVYISIYLLMISLLVLLN